MTNTRIIKSFIAAFLGIILSHNTNATRINGHEIHIPDDGDVVSYTATPNATNIFFEIDGDNITVGSMNDTSPPSLIQKINQIHTEVAPKLVPIPGYGREFEMEATEGSIVIRGRTIKAGLNIILSSPTEIDIDCTTTEASNKAYDSCCETKRFLYHW